MRGLKFEIKLFDQSLIKVSRFSVEIPALEPYLPVLILFIDF